MRRQERTDRAVMTDHGLFDQSLLTWDLSAGTSNSRPIRGQHYVVLANQKRGNLYISPMGPDIWLTSTWKHPYHYDEIITLIFCVHCSSFLQEWRRVFVTIKLFLNHSGLHGMFSKAQKVMSPLQWWVRLLTSRTRIRTARSPRPRGGLLLWEAGIMTRVTQTIYNPGNAELWLVRSANAGLWLAGTRSSISSKNIFKI